MDDNLKITIQKIRLLSEQNADFKSEMQKLFGNTVATTSVTSNEERITNIEKYLGLDYYVDTMPSLIDYSFIKEPDVRVQLISDNREMLRFRYGTRFHSIKFDEFCRYAQLQAEMLINYYYYKTDENIDKIINIDQSPIGRTPRSNPATYTGVFDDIRDVFTQTKEAKIRGYDKSRFSFNVKGGRCEACWGDGVKRIEMHFLPDVYVPCEVCGGTRYNSETLEIKYKGKSIYDVLEMRVEEALEFFENHPKVRNKLQMLQDVGLSYVKLGQSAPTLSGGEAARVKLAKELQKKPTGKSLFILDEPTTGLHSEDIKKLLVILQRIVDNGDTVIVIEHNLDVIKVADYIIDLGPEGGDQGGQIVAQGTPEEVVKVKESYTGQFLKPLLEQK